MNTLYPDWNNSFNANPAILRKYGMGSRQVLAGLIASAAVSPPRNAQPLLRRVLSLVPRLVPTFHGEDSDETPTDALRIAGNKTAAAAVTVADTKDLTVLLRGLRK